MASRSEARRLPSRDHSSCLQGLQLVRISRRVGTTQLCGYAWTTDQFRSPNE